MNNSHTNQDSYERKYEDTIPKDKTNYVKNKNEDTLFTDYIPRLLDYFHRPPLPTEDVKTNDNAGRERSIKVQGLLWKSSFSIVLPKSFAISLGIEKGDFVKVYTDDQKIIVEKAS